MGIRQTLNDNPVVTTSVTGVIIVAAIFFLFRSACSGPGGGGDRTVPTKEYFSVDDGATYFPEDAKTVPPFQHQGKTAYRVKVYKCPDGTTFVNHLERFSEADKKRMEAALAAQPAGGDPKNPMPPDAFVLAGNMEIKKPGGKEWVKMSDGVEKYLSVLRPKCPDGSVNATPVLPD